MGSYWGRYFQPSKLNYNERCYFCWDQGLFPRLGSKLVLFVSILIIAFRSFASLLHYTSKIFNTAPTRRDLHPFANSRVVAILRLEGWRYFNPKSEASIFFAFKQWNQVSYLNHCIYMIHSVFLNNILRTNFTKSK